MVTATILKYCMIIQCFLFLAVLTTISGYASTGERGLVSPKSGNDEVDANIIVIADEISRWVSLPEPKLDNMPFHLQEMMIAINESLSERIYNKRARALFDFDFCPLCDLFGSVIIAFVRTGGAVNIITKFTVALCYIFFYQSKEVCEGVVYGEKDVIEYIIKNTNAMGSDFCKLILPEDCGPFEGPNWSVSIPERRAYEGGQRTASDRIFQSSSIREEAQNFAASKENNFGPKKKIIKLLHLTDPHFDPDYVVGSNAVCEAPMCCNADSGKVRYLSHKAGRWGDYRDCDSPKWLMESMFQHIKDNHADIDLIFYTGDFVSHYLWKVNKATNIKVIDDLVDMVDAFFPNVPTYCAVGNHDSLPSNNFAPPEIPEVFKEYGNQWLYDATAKSFEKLIGNQALPETARYAGCFSVLIRPDFRIISINTNFCYIYNWWIIYKSDDPGNVLSWLVQELQGAEERNEIVHIIGHVPPLHFDCYTQWATQFSRVITRYSHIIRGQYYGHTHLDEIHIQYDAIESRSPVGVLYVTPNNGAFSGVNPSYRIFYIDGDHPETTRNVMDFDTYVMNLTHANIYNDPDWHKLYSARQDLELQDLQPESWHKLAQRLAKEPELFEKYFRYRVQDSDEYIKKGCDFSCKQRIIKSMVDGNGYLQGTIT